MTFNPDENPSVSQTIVIEEWDERIMKPIRAFLLEMGDDREFASECELEALFRIALKHPDEWKADKEGRQARLKKRLSRLEVRESDAAWKVGLLLSRPEVEK